MSPWDRRAEIRRVGKLFDEAEDEAAREALLEKLGTPTRAAVELARDYVATPPPDTSRWDNMPPPLPDEPEPPQAPLPVETFSPEAAEGDLPEPDAGGDAAAPMDDFDFPLDAVREKPAARGAGVFGFVVLILVLGVPVTLLLIGVGVPVLACGAAMIYFVLDCLIWNLRSFRLFSDLLLACGAGCIVTAAGLFFGWLGLFLSVTLTRLWIGNVLSPLGSVLMYGRRSAGDD